MNITVKIEATELADAISSLAVALGDMMSARAEMKADATTKEVVAKAKKPAPAPSEPTPPPVAEGSASEVAAPTVAEVRAACDKVVEKHGIPKVQEVMQSFGVKFAKDLAEDQRATALLKLKELL